VLADVDQTDVDDKGLAFEKQKPIPVELPQPSEEVAETEA
jgi:hypothetical protein